jgi:hypothetical protein
LLTVSMRDGVAGSWPSIIITAMAPPYSRPHFKGLLVLDRWMVEPSLNNLVSDPGPDLGLPKF